MTTVNETKGQVLKFHALEKAFFSAILNTLIVAQTIPLKFHQFILTTHFVILIPSYYNINIFLERYVQIPLLCLKSLIILCCLIELSF